jgi:hypothetical protein
VPGKVVAMRVAASVLKLEANVESAGGLSFASVIASSLSSFIQCSGSIMEGLWAISSQIP